MMFYFIHNQYKKIKDETDAFDERKLTYFRSPLFDSNYAVLALEREYLHYKACTLTINGWLKSIFISSSRAFKARVACSERLKELRGKIKDIQETLGENVPPEDTKNIGQIRDHMLDFYDPIIKAPPKKNIILDMLEEEKPLLNSRNNRT